MRVKHVAVMLWVGSVIALVAGAWMARGADERSDLKHPGPASNTGASVAPAQDERKNVLPALGSSPTERTSKSKAIGSVFEIAPAYHWRSVSCEGPADRKGEAASGIKKGTSEGWGLQHTGSRIEIRGEDSQLVWLIVDTPRWHYHWDCRRKLVIATPSRLGDPSVALNGHLLFTRNTAFAQVAGLGAKVARDMEIRGGRETEKLTCYCQGVYTADKLGPAHSREEATLGKASGAPLGTRTYWFEPKTGRPAGYRCGCSRGSYEVWIDYPAPEQLSKSVFAFSVPPDATLEVRDPELGRSLEKAGRQELSQRN